MSRVLIGVAAVQTALLIFLSVRLAQLDARLQPPPESAPEPAADERAEAAPRMAPVSATGSLDAETVRQIVRDELRFFISSQAPAVGAQQSLSEVNPALAAEVSRDFDRYVGRGRISPREMADFQTKMARLPPAERTEMLRKLTKAMNDGRLAGQF